MTFVCFDRMAETTVRRVLTHDALIEGHNVLKSGPSTNAVQSPRGKRSTASENLADGLDVDLATDELPNQPAARSDEPD